MEISLTESCKTSGWIHLRTAGASRFRVSSTVRRSWIAGEPEDDDPVGVASYTPSARYNKMSAINVLALCGLRLIDRRLAPLRPGYSYLTMNDRRHRFLPFPLSFSSPGNATRYAPAGRILGGQPVRRARDVTVSLSGTRFPLRRGRCSHASLNTPHADGPLW